MTTRKIFLLLTIALILTVCILAGAIIFLRYRNPKVNSFEFSDYQHYVDEFPLDKNVGAIIDAKDATKKAETVWMETYGKAVTKQKPYEVFYDAANKVWLVKGTVGFQRKGGVAHILMNSTGDVLAVWHTK